MVLRGCKPGRNRLGRQQGRATQLRRRQLQWQRQRQSAVQPHVVVHVNELIQIESIVVGDLPQVVAVDDVVLQQREGKGPGSAVRSVRFGAGGGQGGRAGAVSCWSGHGAQRRWPGSATQV
jgi:hypothetical protein